MRRGRGQEPKAKRAHMKSLGQNFLRDDVVLQEILVAAELRENDTVVEIGPGQGVMTFDIAKLVKNVIAIEKDEALVAQLSPKLQEFGNITLIAADALTFNIEQAVQRVSGGLDYKVVANLPYYVATHIIQQLLQKEHPPERILAMVQKEVAYRMAAEPPDMSLLGCTVQYFAEAHVLFDVAPESFWPRPKVESAVILIQPRSKDALLDETEQKKLFQIMKIGFSQKRKKLSNNLAGGLQLEKEFVEKCIAKIGYNSGVRAEQLSLENWKRLRNGLFGEKPEERLDR